MKVETAGLDVFDRIFWNSDNGIMAQEAIEQTDSTQWENVVGSGPYMLTGYVGRRGIRLRKEPQTTGGMIRFTLPWKIDCLHR